jgi:predicted nucleic acid-binding protein
LIAYLDSSVLLRLLLGSPGRLASWDQVERGMTSALAEVECLRTLDRLHLDGKLGGKAHAERRAAVFDLLSRLEILSLSPGVLTRASQPLPTPLGTLDAIHLASALMLRELRAPSLVLATHDLQLATAARAMGLGVAG